jgi:hypothetical protein
MLGGIVVALLPAAGHAQVIAPPPPARYRVVLRYRLDMPAAARVPAFFRLLRDLEQAGFTKDPDGPEDEPANRSYTTMTGIVGSANARRLPRVRFVRRVLIQPSDYVLPDDPKAPVKVAIELQPLFEPARQARLVEQMRPLLRKVGFREAVGYDNRDHTRLAGTIPAGRLDSLLDDLRRLVKGELPDLLGRFWPVRLIEVTPEPAGVAPARELPTPPAEPKGQLHLRKISPELRRLLGAGRRERIEVILDSTPADTFGCKGGAPDEDRSYVPLLQNVGRGIEVEDRLGSVVTLTAPLALVEALARRSEVLGIRLPRSGAAPMQPIKAPAKGSGLNLWSVDRLHARGARGQGVRVLVIAEDFRGWERFAGKGLPAKTKLLDLTAERSPTIEPLPEAGDPTGIGSGTYQALAVARVAPRIDLTLLRVGVGAADMVARVDRYLAGDRTYSPALRTRLRELLADQRDLDLEAEALLEERRVVLDATDEEAIAARRAAYFKRQAEHNARQTALSERRARYLALVEAIRKLTGIRIVSCGLCWPIEYPVDGRSALTRRLNAQNSHCRLCLQASGDTYGQSWAGLYSDEDGNRVMEFARRSAPLPPGRWTRELNFLAWQPHEGKRALDLPAGATVRVTVQWREFADRQFRDPGDELTLPPRINLGLLVLRQRDPSGTRLRTDDLEVVARTLANPPRRPLRLDTHIDSALYEQAVEFSTDKGGRFAIRVDGTGRPALRLQDEPTIRAAEKFWELRPRVFVEVLDAASRQAGRPVLVDFARGEGSVGMPADANGAITVGSADSSGKRRIWSPDGSPWSLHLLRKAEIIVPDSLTLDRAGGVRGSAISTGFAAGVAAGAVSLGYSTEELHQIWREGPRDRFVVAPARRKCPPAPAP